MRAYKANRSPEQIEKDRTYFREYAARLKSNPVKAQAIRDYRNEWNRKAKMNPEYRDKWLANQRRSSRLRRRERKQWFREYKKGLRCVHCGNARRLHFHHRRILPTNKSVSLLVCQGNSMKTILAEIAKCDPVCFKCHHKIHTKERREAKVSG